MSERIRGSYDDALYKSTYIRYFLLSDITELFQPNTVLWAFHAIQPFNYEFYSRHGTS